MTPQAVRLPNWVGDVVMSLPALAHLRESGFALHLFGRPWAAQLLESFADPFTPLPGTLRGDARVIRAAGARHGLVFPTSVSTAAAMRLAGVAAVGYGRQGRSPLLARAVSWRGRPRHEVESYFRLATEVTGKQGVGPPAELTLPIADNRRQEAERARRDNGVGDRCVVLAPLATGRIGGHSKQWPHFGELGDHLHRHHVPVVVCPGPGEAEACRQVLPHAVVIPGMGLGGYAAMVADAQLTVANDSGPMHLAAAAGGPVLGIFGVGDPGRSGPWGPQGEVVGDGRGWPPVGEVCRRVDRLLADAGPGC